MPRVTFDPSTRILTVDLQDGEVVGTVPFPDDSHLVDVDDEGQALALEILTPDALCLDEMALRFGFADAVPEIRRAIGRAMWPPMTGTHWDSDLTVVHADVMLSGDVAPGRSASGSIAAREIDLLPG